MKALILAAGFGTRLLPYSRNIPKPLFPIAGRPLLDIIIQRLADAGCSGILINTHHLHHQIDDFLDSRQYPIPVSTRYEPEILETGGAVKNVADFWDDAPFLVVNGDILSDIDLKAVYAFHCRHPHPATLVLHDYSEFNNVCVDDDDFIQAFRGGITAHGLCASRMLAFTGIHVMDPKVLKFIPGNVSVSIIEAYRKMIADGLKIKAFISENHYWNDIGSPAKYRQAVYDQMAPAAFRKAFPQSRCDAPRRKRLKGDGSDRIWHRIISGGCSLVMADHGIRQAAETAEADSFVAIGRHLHQNRIPVPEIHHADTFCGLVFMEDLGDTHLQSLIRGATTDTEILQIYRSVIDILIRLSQSGIEGFQPSWTHQTTEYNLELILEKECRYFVDAFLNGYLGMKCSFDTLRNDFQSIAETALKYGITGLMHRDFQSRNIMVKDNRFYVIDFQGARLGPIQYDLASLLIDPYVDLSSSLQEQLLDYCVHALSSRIAIQAEAFCRGYTHCAITRNLQMLGAFGYLSRVKGKTDFERYIPTAVQTLKNRLNTLADDPYPCLKAVVDAIALG